jgi:hypothetical protein
LPEVTLYRRWRFRFGLSARLLLADRSSQVCFSGLWLGLPERVTQEGGKTSTLRLRILAEFRVLAALYVRVVRFTDRACFIGA